MPCGKDMLVLSKIPYDQKRIAKFSKEYILRGNVFGFAQVDTEVPNELMTSFTRCHHCLLFKKSLIVIYSRK